MKNAMPVVVLALVIGMSSPMGCDRYPEPVLDGLRSALASQPDSTTRDAMQALVGTIDAEDWGYLTFAQWPDDGGTAALRDPTLRKAMNALVTARGLAPLAARGGGGSALRAQATGGPGPTFAPLGVGGDTPRSAWLALWYPQAIQLMQFQNKLDYAGTPGVAAAFADLLAKGLSGQAGSPLPDPTQAADEGVAGCGKSFYDGTGQPSPSCSATDFCCKGSVDYDTGESLCSDYESCRGMGRPC